jgi:hypothetical protein
MATTNQTAKNKLTTATAVGAGNKPPSSGAAAGNKPTSSGAAAGNKPPSSGAAVNISQPTAKNTSQQATINTKQPATNTNNPAPQGLTTNSSLNSIVSANNTGAGPVGTANTNFDKALNAEFGKEGVATNNKTKMIKGLNSRVKTSQQLLDADKPPAESSGFFGKISSLAKSAANNLIPGSSKEINTNNDLEAGTLIDVQANAENYVIILGVFIVLVLVIIIYFFSKTFNVSRTLAKMAMYPRYQSISSLDMTQEQSTDQLYKFQIASSYNSCHSGSQMFSYTSELILKSVLKSGARYIELNIFSSKYGPKGIPVVDSGYARGEWKLMLNTTTFESAIRLISENAFRVASSEAGVPNNTDPLFIGLNLATGGNTYCLDLMADILTDYFRDKLLDAKYAFQFNTDFAKTPLRQLENKVVIFSSPGFEGSKLEEFVNAVWYTENFSSSAGLGSNTIADTTVEGFQASSQNNRKTTQQTTKQRKKRKISSADKLSALTRSLTKEASGAKQSNKTSSVGAVSEGQISAEKDKLTKNIRSLADELKESGLDVLDVEELEPAEEETTNDTTQNKKTSDARNTIKETEEFAEATADIPSPTGLGLDQILGNQQGQARIMRICAQDFDSVGFDGGRIQAFTSAGGLVLVVPHREGDYITRNYDPQRAFELGCQFIAMNFQDIDTNMDKYITRFETKAILPTS